MEEAAGVDGGEDASNRGREDAAVIEDGESASIEGAAGGIAHKPTTGEQSREVARRDSGTALRDGEKHAEGLGSESRGHSLPSAENEARGSGRGAESGNGSDVDQAGGLETDGGVVHRVDRDRVGMGHLRNTSNLSNSSHHREETVISDRGGVRENDDLEADLTGDRESSGLYHRPGASSSTAPSSPSAENFNEIDFSTKDKPLQRASGSRGGGMFSSSSRSRSEEVDGSIRERSDENNDGMGNDEALAGVHGGVHGANISHGIHGERGRGDQEYPGFASTKNATARGAAGDVENTGFANDGTSGVQARGGKRGDAAHAGVLQVEDMADANGRQTPAQPRLEEREREQPRGGDVGGTDSEGSTIKQNKGSRNSNINDDGDRSNRHGGEAQPLLVGHDTTDGLSAHPVARPTSGGDDRILLQGENLGVGTSGDALTPGDVGSDKRVAAGGDREPGGGSSDPNKHNESKGGDLGPKLRDRREDTTAAPVPSQQCYGAAGSGASGHEGKEEDDQDLQGPREARDRWASSVPGGAHGDDGTLSVKPEQSSLQEDGSGAVSSISSAQWKPSPTKTKEAREVGVEGEQEQDDGVGGGVVSGDGPGQREKTSAGAGTGTGRSSHDVSSSADNKGLASRRQVRLRMSSKGTGQNTVQVYMLPKYEVCCFNLMVERNWFRPKKVAVLDLFVYLLRICRGQRKVSAERPSDCDLL